MAMIETCSRCGEEVRWGWRHGRQAYWHRVDVDHVPIFGKIFTAEDAARVQAEFDVVRHRTVTRSKKVDGEKVTWEEEETYTVRDWDLERWRKSKKFREAEEAEGDDEEEDVEVEPYPEPEQRAEPIDASEFPPRSGIRQILNLLVKQDWETVSLTRSRGPYVGGKGQVLSISESVLVRARGTEVDNGTPVAVASWRDGKFDFAYIGTISDGRIYTRGANATELKTWIKDPSP